MSRRPTSAGTRSTDCPCVCGSSDPGSDDIVTPKDEMADPFEGRVVVQQAGLDMRGDRAARQVIGHVRCGPLGDVRKGFGRLDRVVRKVDFVGCQAGAPSIGRSPSYRY